LSSVPTFLGKIIVLELTHKRGSLTFLDRATQETHSQNVHTHSKPDPVTDSVSHSKPYREPDPVTDSVAHNKPYREPDPVTDSIAYSKPDPVTDSIAHSKPSREPAGGDA
jgi:hypothetical protein